jgi:hypothetical protein
MTDTSVVRRFDAEMQRIHDEAKAIRLPRDALSGDGPEHGGLETAHRLLAGTEIGYGFAELWMLGRQDLTVEAVALRPEYAELFSDEELRTARTRLGL